MLFSESFKYLWDVVIRIIIIINVFIVTKEIITKGKVEASFLA